ncbi:XrtJ-associated TM-motif-TM protein [Granulicella rosea]|jgi:XrtJ-associated TM-motif-TM protein|uniref:XrtJ-associated TM-motif-TM protein n=1 Tax=Granulicella rosea TaxID=474952 RepID=A0A239CTU5_9BACT|nr:PExPT-CTERM protein [Granulicella rosea]SNS23530.1 XrtJ-associated TM-motif-TM protein [Granulicella rosea]
MTRRIGLIALVILIAPLAAHAQTGCDNSPENPTIVLALVGGAGAAFTSLRARLGRKR